jgi:hypothetical protein
MRNNTEPLLASGQHAKMEVLLEAVFSTDPLQGIITLPAELNVVELRVEAGSNTSKVALRVVGGDGKGTQCLGI